MRDATFLPGAKARKYLEAARVGLKNRFAYRGNAAGRLLTYGLFVFVFSRIWNSAFAGRDSIAGYGRSAAIWYFIVAEIPAFGFSRFFGTVGADVKSGQIAYLVARPYSFVGYSFAQAIGPALADAALLGLLGAGLGLAFAGPLPLTTPVQAGALLLSLLAAACLQFLLQTSLALTAFWMEENSAFFWIYQKIVLVAGTLLPVEFLPERAREIVLLTPFPYLTWAPARMAVAYSPGEAARLLAVQAGWIAASALLCGLVYRAGRRRIVVQGG